MNLDTQLLIGIILIAVGLILALLAYYILTQPTAEGEEPEPETGEQRLDEEEAFEAGATIPHEVGDETEGPPSDSEEEPLPDESPTPQVEPPSDTPSSLEAAREQPEQEEDESEPAEPEATIPPAPEERSFTVATLLRDEITGKLMVRVGERVYKAPDELRDSTDWTRVKFAASDLIEWVPAAERERDVEREQHAAGPKTMIEQINEILQERLADAGEDQKAIRLIEAADGSVRVLIGVKSYSLDDVPDPEVGRFIREAVSAWEDLQ
jgi:hypothetical protein